MQVFLHVVSFSKINTKKKTLVVKNLIFGSNLPVLLKIFKQLNNIRCILSNFGLLLYKTGIYHQIFSN